MKISKLNIETSFTKFVDQQYIDIPNSKETNCVFIYGKNGSGKSSISKLFSISNKVIDGKEYLQDLIQLKTKSSDKSLSVKIYYDNGNITEYSDKRVLNPIKTPVFNQEYIDTKITYQEDFKNNKFKENTLNYGVELKTKTEYISKLKEGKIEQAKKEELIKKIDDKIRDNINLIKSDTSTKDSNKNYSMFTIENFKNMDITKMPLLDELNKRRLEHIKYIQNLKDLNDSNKVHLKIDFLDSIAVIEKKIENVNRSISFSEDKAKTASSREILDSLDEELRQWKLTGVLHIKDNKCPFCSSDISGNELVSMYKDYVNSKISKMKEYLTAEIKNFGVYKNNVGIQLETAKSKAQYLDTIFQGNLLDDIQIFNVNLNAYLEQILTLLSQKNTEENIFNDCSESIEIVDIAKLETIKNDYDKLLIKIAEVNKKIDSSTSDKTKRNDDYFKNVALYLVFYGIKSEIENLKNVEEKIKKILTELEPLKIAYEKELKEKNILLKKINEILDDFNINNYRVDEEFDLCLNGEKVSFCVDKLLSNGEKSVIAFALFISELELYYTEKDKYIIFIDDPISSVDYPNLYGIYNYINNLIESNKNSQFIISSHNTVFMNLFKFDYPNKRATYFKFIEIDGKTKIIIDNDNLDSIYLEKLKEIFVVFKTNIITNNQKLYIHNYCRYVLETISRFEYPINDNESTSSKYYIKKIISNIENKIDDYGISKVALQSLIKIVNKGSHATIDEVHDGEHFEDNHYIESCKAIIKFIKKEYNGQYELLSSDYDKMNALNTDK